ncbi:MAG: extracellular solute-binding protein, partial [Deinococcus-Thermus bacterium]|nr:extracellular solute-binding protein [Deinococcota bacterium]
TALTLLALLLPFGLAQTELTIAHAMTGGADRDAFDQIVAAFEEVHPDITVDQVVQDDDLYEDAGLITMLQSNDPPDIFFQWGGALVQRDAEQGFAADLTDALEAGGFGDWFVDAAWSPAAGTVVDGRVYMIPNSLDVTTALWYNLDLFEEHGLEEPETWPEFLEVVRTLADAGVTPIIIGNNEFWPLGNWAGHITQRVVGMDLLDRALRLEEPFQQEPFVEAFTRFEELADAGAFNADLTSLGADPAMNAFFQGAAAMHPIGSWLVPISAENAPEGFRYDVFNTPEIPGGDGAPNSVIGLATGFEVSADSENYDEAIAFLRFFAASLETQKMWAEAGQFSPVQGAMQIADLDPHTVALAEMFETADALVPPPDTGYPVEVADVFYEGAALVASGTRDAEGALAWIDEQLEPIRAERD